MFAEIVLLCKILGPSKWQKVPKIAILALFWILTKNFLGRQGAVAAGYVWAGVAPYGEHILCIRIGIGRSTPEYKAKNFFAHQKHDFFYPPSRRVFAHGRPKSAHKPF